MNRKGWVMVVLGMIVLGVAGVVLYGLMADRVVPEVRLAREAGTVSAQGFDLEATDEGTGLSALVVRVRQGGTATDVVQRMYPRGTARATERVSLADAGLKPGEFEVFVEVSDYPALPLFRGHTSDGFFRLVYDSQPPVITVRSRAHNLNQGGSGLVVYELSEPVNRSGVMVGTRFFPGYRQASGLYACLFACPYDLPAKEFSPRLVAEDQAGNSATTGFYYHTNAKTFPRDRISISQSFLGRVMPQFEQDFPGTGAGIELFIRVNRDLRKANREKLEETGLVTAPEPLWTGQFLRMSGAATEAKFAEARAYIYEGREVDHQTHLGYDFASLSQAPVLASNRGRVAFAGRLGIYGKCVVLDHGLGLQSLYGHLSDIVVTEGDTVEKGGRLGLSGSTGMAGGDHLHFEVSLSGLPVNPLEWLDPNWVKNNVTDKLALAGVK